MPIHMAMEKPNTWIHGAEADHRIARRRHHPRITTHRHSGKGASVVVPEQGWMGPSMLGSGNIDAGLAGDKLRRMAVNVDGVGAAIVVVDDNVVDVALFEDEGLGVVAVDDRVGGVFAGAHDGHEGGDFLPEVGDVVKTSPGFVRMVDPEVDGLWHTCFVHLVRRNLGPS